VTPGLALLIICSFSVGDVSHQYFIGDGVSRAFDFDCRALLVGSESVTVGESALGRDGYRLDCASGRLVIWSPPGRWEPVRLVYRRLPYQGAQSAIALRVSDSQSPATDSPPAVARAFVVAESPGLELSGSKTLGVSVGGAEGGGIDQATRIALNGSVEGVQVSAELTDQSTGLPELGTTRDITELDRVLVELRAERWRGTFGDVDLKVPLGRFGSVSRRVTGVEAAVSAAGANARAAFASPRGRHGRVVLDGSDGLQGPYLLAPDGRSAQLVVASEQVWLDGRRLVRGFDQDYTIDYSTGELEFTGRNVITRRSRIEADFQYLTTAWSRTDLAAGADYHFGPLGLAFTVLREGDDPQRSLEEELTDSDRRYLATIGADTSRAWLDGAQYVGPGNGDYVQDGGHYRFAGADSGDWRVRFTLVGDSLGDYVYDDTLYACRFAGAGQGNYVARVRVELPVREDLVHAAASVGSGNVSAHADGAFRRQNRNLFADDGARLDAAALDVGAGWEDSVLGASYRRRMYSDDFELAATTTSPDFSWRWGGVQETLVRTSDELAARLTPRPGIRIDAGAGRLGLVSAAAAWRYGVALVSGLADLSVQRAGAVDRAAVLAHPRFGAVLPRAGWDIERGQLLRINRFSGGCGYEPGTYLSASLEHRQELTDDSAGPARTGGLTQGSVDWNPGPAISMNATAAWQDERFVRSPAENWQQLIGTLRAAASPRAGLRLSADLSRRQRLVQLRDETFRYVGPDKGTYRRDTVGGGYVPDPDGDYELVSVATGRFKTAREWSADGSGELAAFDPFALSATYSQTRTDGDSGVLGDVLRADARVSLRFLEPLASPAFGVSRDQSVDRALSVSGRASLRDNAWAEVATARLTGASSRVRAEVTHERRDRTSGDVEYDLFGWRTQAFPVVGARLRLEVEAELGRDAIEEPLARPDLGRFGLWTVGLEAGRTFQFGRTRLRGSAGFTRRDATVAELPYDIALLRPVGWTPRAGAELGHAFSDVLTALARYSFQDRPDRPADHAFSAQFQAHF
jgi:hypothetical protein